MSRSTLFRVWAMALDPDLCDVVRNLGTQLTAIPATVAESHGKPAVYDERRRKAQVGFWDERHWLNGLLWHFTARANAEAWRFDIALCAGVQFATYDPGAFFDWHKDEFDYPYDDVAPPHWRGLNRKLSVVGNLSDGEGYQGGNLLFKDPWGNTVEVPELREKGTVVVFPSYVVHTVTPVTGGVRHSIVGWVLGPSLR